MNYLGIDWGGKKTGFAIASDAVKVASPILTLTERRVDLVIEKISEIIKDENIDMLIVGKPVSLSGGEKFLTQYDDFISRLKTLGVPFEQVDERMSSKFARKLIKKDGGKTNMEDDELAAAIVLQSYLDRCEK